MEKTHTHETMMRRCIYRRKKISLKFGNYRSKLEAFPCNEFKIYILDPKFTQKTSENLRQMFNDVYL